MSNQDFAKRLSIACENHPRAPNGHGIQAWLRRELEKEGVKVVPEAVRRWFAGENRPKVPMIKAIAQVLGVDEAWLALGITPSSTPSENVRTNAMANGAINLVAGQIQLAGGVIAYPEAGTENDLYAILHGKQVAVSIRLGAKDPKFTLSVAAKPNSTIAVIPTDNPVHYRFFGLPATVIQKTGTVRGGYTEIEVRRAADDTYRVGKTVLPEVLDFTKLANALKDDDGISDGTQ